MRNVTPAYLHLFNHHQEEFSERIDKAYTCLAKCNLCVRKCQVNRLKDEKGFCGAGKNLKIASFNPHFGEEKELVGFGGSGTIFLSGCNLKCVFCQNYDISQKNLGYTLSEEKLAGIMLTLQANGCHNINFVTPTHFTPQILKAVFIAVKQGLHLPLVYNSGGYDALNALQLLEGIFDIYLPDFKYMDKEKSEKYSQAPEYPEVAKQAIREMYRQVKGLKVNEQNIAYRGLYIRHLIMPNNLSDSKKFLTFIASISTDIKINLMDQYHPAYQAFDYPELNLRISAADWTKTVAAAQKLGFTI